MAESRYIGNLIKEAKAEGKEVVVISTKEELDNLMMGIDDVKNTIVVIEDIEKLLAGLKPTPNEAENDLIKLLKIMPSVSLVQDQNLSEMLYRLRIKYNVPIVRGSSENPPTMA